MAIIQLKIARYFIAHIAFIIFIIFKMTFKFIANFDVLNKKVYEIIKFKAVDKTHIIILFIIIIISSF